MTITNLIAGIAGLGSLTLTIATLTTLALRPILERRRWARLTLEGTQP